MACPLFFLRLPGEPVTEAVQTPALIESGNGQIKVGGVEFLVDLILQQRFHLCVHDGSPWLKGGAELHRLMTKRSVFSGSCHD